MILNKEEIKEKIRSFMRADPQASFTKNNLSKMLSLKGDARKTLKEALSEMKSSAEIVQGKQRRLMLRVDVEEDTAKNTFRAEITEVDEDGMLYARPIGPHTPCTRIRLTTYAPFLRQRTNLGVGTYVLIKITKKARTIWDAQVLKEIEHPSRTHLGLFQETSRGGTLFSCHRKDAFSPVFLSPHQAEHLHSGQVVVFQQNSPHDVIIHKILGEVGDTALITDMAIHNHQIIDQFSSEALKIASSGRVPSLGKRYDYRAIPFVTIDGEDARDFDDAVWAEPDAHPDNEKGWHILVAIADVAYYVPLGSELDQEAYARGNSVYFPDRAVPMLPEALSNDLCSLRPNEDRACLVVEMTIDVEGKLKSHKIQRGLMRSIARLTYEQVEHVIHGAPSTLPENILPHIHTLYGAYKSLHQTRLKRGTLELEGPEREFVFDNVGHVIDVKIRPNLTSHKIIEEFMIAANVVAAETLVSQKMPSVFRIHDRPNTMKVHNLAQLLKHAKIPFTKSSHPKPTEFNTILKKFKGTAQERLLNELILRAQSQARYSTENIGHFGLSLTHYTHFTSPIRRYSDLIVHRLLVSALGLGDGGYPDLPDDLQGAADHVSQTERRASAAERETSDRFAIALIAPFLGHVFSTVIVGVNRAGLFVETLDSGAQGFIPKRSLDPRGHIVYDEAHHQLINKNTGHCFQLGQQLEATLVEADVMTSSLSFRLPSPGRSSANKGIPSKMKSHKKRRSPPALKNNTRAPQKKTHPSTRRKKP